MVGPQAGDVLIRVQTNTMPTTYVLIDVGTRRVLAGPFPSIAEAAIAATKKVSPMAAVWQEIQDQRGGALGPPVRFPAMRS